MLIVSKYANIIMTWRITFYNDKIEKLILNWPVYLKVRWLKILRLIKEEGPNLGMPLTKAMGNGLFEIRVQARGEIGRVFFAYITKQELIILHAFIKKTQKTPNQELQIARQRLQEVKHYALQT